MARGKSTCSKVCLEGCDGAKRWFQGTEAKAQSLRKSGEEEKRERETAVLVCRHCGGRNTGLIVAILQQQTCD